MKTANHKKFNVFFQCFDVIALLINRNSLKLNRRFTGVGHFPQKPALKA